MSKAEVYSVVAALVFLGLFLIGFKKDGWSGAAFVCFALGAWGLAAGLL